MRLARCCLLLCLVPCLLCASFYAKDHAKIIDRITVEWNQHGALILEFNSLPISERESHLSLLQEAIACCQRAVQYCDSILKQIGDKPKIERKFWTDVKEQCKKDKKAIQAEIKLVQALIDGAEAFGKAASCYQESERRAQLAEVKNQSCPRRLDNVEEVISTLNEMGRLYEEAAALAREALSLMASHPDEVSKNTLRQAMDIYQGLADQCMVQAANWPNMVLVQEEMLKEKLAILEGEVYRLSQNGLASEVCELLDQAIPILEQMIEGGLDNDELQLKEKLSCFKGIIAG